MRATYKLLTGLLLLSFIVTGCAMYKGSLKTQEIGAMEPSGTYTVMRYGNSSYEEYDSFALIVPESGKYTFEIYKPSFDYRSSTGLTANQALDMAKTFVGRHPEFARSQISGIISPGGEVIGYEVRPLYKQTRFGMEDLITVSYLLKENNVIEVRIDLDEKVKNVLRGGDNDSHGGK
jgi:hypothetical protein